MVTGKVFLIQIFIDTLLSQRDPIREEFILGLYRVLSLNLLRMCAIHTFPLLSLLGARRSGIGIGGRETASFMVLLDLGVWS